MSGYLSQRSELRSQQAHLAALEDERRGLIAEIAAADTPEVLEMRARAQGLVRPGERAFAIHGELEPPPPPPAEENDGGGLLGWLPDIF